MRWAWWDFRDRLASALERVYLCKIKRRHLEKMDSRGRCYRCGTPVAGRP